MVDPVHLVSAQKFDAHLDAQPSVALAPGSERPSPAGSRVQTVLGTTVLATVTLTVTVHRDGTKDTQTL